MQKNAAFKVFSKNVPSPLPRFEGTKEEVYNWLDNNMYAPAGFHVYITETEQYQDAREFMEENCPFVSKYYRMDPETEDLFPNGRHLRNGMRVLVGKSGLRVDVNRDDLNDWEEERAFERNRWCTVGALEIKDDGITFIGVYDDGSKMMRTYSIDSPWLVKIDSLARFEETDPRVAKIVELVDEVMGDAIVTSMQNESQSYKKEHLRQKAVETAIRIRGLFPIR